jgi:hypothetical protein
VLARVVYAVGYVAAVTVQAGALIAALVLSLWGPDSGSPVPPFAWTLGLLLVGFPLIVVVTRAGPRSPVSRSGPGSTLSTWGTARLPATTSP